MGLAGVIVSNHGGRTLDTTVSTAWALPRVVEAVGPDWPVLVDGGIRRGTDVFKALALGAHAVMIGRPYLHGLAVAGALGVAHVIRLLRDELEVAMALHGCRTLDEVRRAPWWAAPPPESWRLTALTQLQFSWRAAWSASSCGPGRLACP